MTSVKLNYLLKKTGYSTASDPGDFTPELTMQRTSRLVRYSALIGIRFW